MQRPSKGRRRLADVAAVRELCSSASLVVELSDAREGTVWSEGRSSRGRRRQARSELYAQRAGAVGASRGHLMRMRTEGGQGAAAEISRCGGRPWWVIADTAEEEVDTGREN